MPVKSKHKRVTSASMHKLALTLIDFLNKKELYGDTTIIYVGTGIQIRKEAPVGRRYANESEFKPIKTPAGLTVFETEYKSDIPTEYHNPKTITVTFEDDLYSEMNRFGKLHDELNNLFKPYGLYLEMGHSWDFSIYPEN